MNIRIKHTKLNQLGFGHHIILPILVMVAVGAIGVKVLEASHAASLPTITLQSNATSTSEEALAWSALPRGSSITGYKITRTDAGGNQTTFSTDRYTANYLDTHLTPNSSYTYTVAAQGGTAETTSNSLNVKTAASTETINACDYNNRLLPGNYILTHDIASSNHGGCLSFTTAANFTIDCKGHRISDKWLGAQTLTLYDDDYNFLIVNCVFSNPTGTSTLATIDNVWHGTFENDTFETPDTAPPSSLNIGNSKSIVMNSDTFSNVAYSAEKNGDVGSNGGDMYVGHSTITINNPTSTTHALVTLSGNGNTVDNNILTGVAEPQSQTGTQDGVFLGQSQPVPTGMIDRDTVANNTISNTANCGVETRGYITNSLFTNNNMNSTYSSGICSHHSVSWVNNQVTDNTIGKTYLQFWFTNDDTTLPTGQTQLYFKDNLFKDNVYTPWAGSNTVSAWFFGQGFSGVSEVATNDTFTHNNFSTTAFGPALPSPTQAPSMVVDGGGNICKAPSLGYIYQLDCHK